MSTPFLGEIRLMSFNFPPRGWAMCNGQIMGIAQNQALFALLGTTYGGNGQTTFALPDLQGRIPIHIGTGFTQGQRSGAETHTLFANEIPAHTHNAVGSSNNADQSSPAGKFCAVPAANTYAAAPNTTMNAAAIQAVGGGQPHPNMPPYLVVTFCIALSGVFPSRN